MIPRLDSVTSLTAQAIAVSQALDALMRADRGRLLAALIARLRDFQLAEEALQEAAASAIVHWGRSGLPHSPQGWLLRVARRKAIDRIRKQGRFRARLPDLEALALADQQDAAELPPDIPDERLRLIFTCCHPAIEPKSQVALTLRLLGGMDTAAIARAFLDVEATMGQRLSRAKAKIAAAGIPFAVPGPELWTARMGSVLAVIYLIFNAGNGEPSQNGQTDLCAEAIWLGRMLADLAPDDPEVLGLLSLMLSTQARFAARYDPTGDLVTLDQQDRGLWDAIMVAEALALLDQAMLARAGGPYQIKAAISALHVAAPDHASTDWTQMLGLYDALLRHEPTDVVRLNRAVVLSRGGDLAVALRVLEQLGARLARYQPYHAARADLLARIGAQVAAGDAYQSAIDLSQSASERRWLRAQQARL